MKPLLAARRRIALVGLVGALLAPSVSAAERIDFNADVRPILSNKCFVCHGPDAGNLKAGLRLDQQESATSETDSGAIAIVPGEPDDSELIWRVEAEDEDVRMPPADKGPPLTAAEIATLRAWIAQGAAYSRHWSYESPERPATPAPPEEFADWPHNPIDHFALARMLEQGLKPSPEADRYALIRRVTLDLTGLPPTIEEAEAFVADNDPLAYEHLVDDLLDRPSFGEHWARKWLDLARYADSAGYADDPPRTIWAYRDWVVRAINNNMPFDQFTIEQMAGDLLPDPSVDQLVATAFHRNTLTNNEGGTQDEEFRNVAVVDRVNTTMAVWMGTTMACAQCHSHKYDPITQEEYFRFFAILNNTQDADRRDESPVVPIFTAEQEKRQAELQAEIAKLEAVMDAPTDQLAASQARWEAPLLGEPSWTTLRPSQFARQSGGAAEVLDDGSLRVVDAAETDVYAVELELPQNGAGKDRLAALRLTTLPEEALPDGGAGLGGGNFVLTGVRAFVVPSERMQPRARFVRITNLGKDQILSLAEVQVFVNGENVATSGAASQHSTAFGGPAELAIDGNTNGDYLAGSVTHTATVEAPWWELDLGEELAIDRVVIWNRTDGGLHTRLTDFEIKLLDGERLAVSQEKVSEPPNPSLETAPGGEREIEFQTAFADYQQDGFEPAGVLTRKTGPKDGWAVGGDASNSHELTLVAKEPVDLGDAAAIRIELEQNSPHQNHLLGRFRLSFTADEAAVARARLPQEIVEVLDAPAATRGDEQYARLASYYRRELAPELASERKQLAVARQQLSEIKPMTTAPILREIVKDRRETRFQFRGSYLDTGAVVHEGLPAAFHPAPDDRPLDRLALAEWLVDEANPLTARVVANRYWESLFGRGIVATSEEFGSQGEPPTHPALLDWLSVEFMESGWDSKHLIRTIVTSSVYRQSAVVTPEAAARDPDNRWLARGPRVRLTAEMVRDQALAVSGLLSDKMYGPPVRPPQPNLGLTAAFGGSTDWKTSEGEDRYRRALYTQWRRSNPYPSMATFDAPNREVCTVRRNSTNTPLQSLVTLNDPVYVEAAQALARLALGRDGSVADQLEYAFRRCLLRTPQPEELAALEALHSDARARLAENEMDAEKLATEPIGALPEGIDAVDAAAMTVVGNVLLNLDEMFLKR